MTTTDESLDLGAEVQQLRAQMDAVRAALTVRPCHITGMHTPNHHARYSCADQVRETFERVLAALGTTYDALPRELHPGKCWNCHEVPSQEKYREQQRETYRWAGVEIPPALAELSPDAPRPGDNEAVLAFVPDERTGWRPVWEAAVEGTGFHRERVMAALDALIASGVVVSDSYSGLVSVRRSSSDPADKAKEASRG